MAEDRPPSPLAELRWVGLDEAGRIARLEDFAVHRGEDAEGKFKAAYDVFDAWLTSPAAMAQHAHGQVMTTVAVHRDRPAGFIATHAHALHDEHVGAKALQLIKPYPCLKVLHLAVHRDYARFGLASELLHGFGIGAAAMMNLSTACRFVYLDALKPVVGFYKKKQFVELPTKKPSEWSTPMIFDLAASPEQFAAFRQLGAARMQALASAGSCGA